MTPEERMKLLLMSKEEKIPPMSPEEWDMIRPSQHPDATDFIDPRNEIMPHRRPWGRLAIEEPVADEMMGSQPVPVREQIREMAAPSIRGDSRMPTMPGYHRMPDGRLMRDGMMEGNFNPQMMQTTRGQISIPQEAGLIQRLLME